VSTPGDLQIIVEDLLIQGVQWRMFFTRRGIEPLSVVYEDLVGAQAQVIQRDQLRSMQVASRRVV
jgi:LPS sulfotransferase NodH